MLYKYTKSLVLVVILHPVVSTWTKLRKSSSWHVEMNALD